MKVYEIGTGYTSIPAKISAATEIIVEQLTLSMMKQKLDVEIIDICDKNRKENSLPITEVKVPSFFVNTDLHLGIIHKIKRVVYSVSLAMKLKKILKATDEKVVFHFHNQYNMFFFLKLVDESLRSKCITAYTNHTGLWRMNWEKIEKEVRERYFQEAECMKKADNVFVLNEETKANIIEHLGVEKENICVINNGVNTDVYTPLTKEEKESIKEKRGFSDKKIIMQIGSVYENKGQARSVELLSELMKEDENILYLYAGGIVDEEYKNLVNETAKRLGVENQVKYLGMISPGKELNEFYNIADATIFPSNYEAFGLVVVEAFSAGVPVLVNEKGTFAFSDGCVIYNEQNFTETVKENIFADESKYKEHCILARKTATENYGWDKISSDYNNFWNKG